MSSQRGWRWWVPQVEPTSRGLSFCTWTLVTLKPEVQVVHDTLRDGRCTPPPPRPPSSPAAPLRTSFPADAPCASLRAARTLVFALFSEDRQCHGVACRAHLAALGLLAGSAALLP